jgi:hypothetical protein
MVHTASKRRSTLIPTLIGIGIVIIVVLLIMLVLAWPTSVETGGGVTPISTP